jgi:DNA-binding SARP family transcriptional activator
MKKDGSAELAIYVLGPFRVSVFGKSVKDSDWARPQAKLLLKLLALEPKHQLHRQQIMDAIWPALDSTSAAANLHKIIHMARRALEPKLKSGVDSHFISTRDQHVQLAAAGGVWVDATEFETNSSRAFRSGNLSEYEDALSLYGGELLSDDLYADWCARRREKLRATYQEFEQGG